MITKENIKRFFWQNIYPFLIGFLSVIIASLVFNQMMEENRVSALLGFTISTLIPLLLFTLFIYLFDSLKSTLNQAVGIIIGMLCCLCLM